MTDRIKGFTVVLDRDMRDDDVEAVADAIRMIKRVATVTPHIVTHEDYMVRERLRHDLKMKMYKLVDEAFNKVE